MESHRSKGIVIATLLGGLILITLIAVHQLSQLQSVSFSVFEEGYSLIAPKGIPRQGPEPALIILASPEDMELPSPFTFPEPLAEKLKQIDFNKSFLILVHRGHPDRGLVKEITRQQEKVIITAYDIVAGPGNYVMDGWTQPYEFIKIDKDSQWSESIHFVLQRETQGILGETVHFIP